MNRLVPLFVVLTLAAPLLASAHPTFLPKTETQSCVNNDPVHDYVLPGTWQVGDRTILAPSIDGVVIPADGNLLLQCTTRGDAHPGDFDGEYEWAIGGGRMPALGSPYAPTCDDGYPIDHSHHGSTYTVADAIGRAWFSIGSDDAPVGWWGGPITAPATDVFDPDGTQCILDGAITPDVDCDDFLSPNWIGFGSANTGPGPVGANTLLTTLLTTVGGVVTTVYGLPLVGPFTQSVVAAVVDFGDAILDLVFGTGVVCPFTANTAFGPGGDGYYTIFVSGAVINDNTPTSIAPIIAGATFGHICNGMMSQNSCYSADGNGDWFPKTPP